MGPDGRAERGWAGMYWVSGEPQREKIIIKIKSLFLLGIYDKRCVIFHLSSCEKPHR